MYSCTNPSVLCLFALVLEGYVQGCSHGGHTFCTNPSGQSPEVGIMKRRSHPEADTSRRMSPGRYSAAADKFSAPTGAEDAGCEDGLSPGLIRLRALTRRFTECSPPRCRRCPSFEDICGICASISGERESGPGSISEQRSANRDRRTEINGARLANRNKRSEIGEPKSANRNQRTEVNAPAKPSLAR